MALKGGTLKYLGLFFAVLGLLLIVISIFLIAFPAYSPFREAYLLPAILGLACLGASTYFLHRLGKKIPL